jgi:hypothetical protein
MNRLELAVADSSRLIEAEKIYQMATGLVNEKGNPFLAEGSYILM